MAPEQLAALEASVKALVPLQARVAALEQPPPEDSLEALEQAFSLELAKACGELLPAVAVRFEKRIKRDANGRAVGIIDVPAEA